MNDPASATTELDSLYRPLVGLQPPAILVSQRHAWAAAMSRLEDFRLSDPARCDMLETGARLAAAYQSAALDGAHPGDPRVVDALISHRAAADDLAGDVGAHVTANQRALLAAARAGALSEALIRHVHELACRPQITHPVQVDGRVQDHVLAHGEYKHHSNHTRTNEGGWRVRAPVAKVGSEMRTLVATMGPEEFGRLHPATRAAHVLQAMTHVAPFADGNARVARALAGGLLLRVSGIPLLVPADDLAAYDGAVVGAEAGDPGALVAFVVKCAVDLVDLIVEPDPSISLDRDEGLFRWEAETAAARFLGEQLPSAVQGALKRHRARTDLGWLPSLNDADIDPPAVADRERLFESRPLVIRAPLPPGPGAEEALSIDAHPLGGKGHVVLRAEAAGLRIDVRVDESADEWHDRLDPWLDRIISTLALRAAAEVE